MKVLIIFCIIAGAIAGSAKIETRLQHALQTNGIANIFVSFEEGTSTALKSAITQGHVARGDKINSIVKALTLNAQKSNVNVLSFLHKNKVNTEQIKTFWISNQVYIKNATTNLVTSLASFPEVSEISLEPIFQLDLPKSALQISALTKELAWGVDKIQADDVWNLDGGNNGEGVIVGGIDTGVRGTHEALAHNFIGEYGWLDPFTSNSTPFDLSGHGTHTMGTILGGNEIGVAPSARWMACRGCDIILCDGNHLLTCGQFMLCPTLPDGSAEDCTKAPQIVSNSWGGPDGQTFYDSTIEAWVAAGIVPIFSAGNGGDGCATTGYPGTHPLAIAVGNTDINDALQVGSSRGPALSGLIKPDVSAPGTNIYSATQQSDTAYGLKTGTSMACPHVSGVAALLLSRDPTLTVEEVKYYLTYGNEQDLIKPGQDCGNVSEDEYPNNAFGHGRINALNSVTKLLEDI